MPSFEEGQIGGLTKPHLFCSTPLVPSPCGKCQVLPTHPPFASESLTTAYLTRSGGKLRERGSFEIHFEKFGDPFFSRSILGGGKNRDPFVHFSQLAPAPWGRPAAQLPSLAEIARLRGCSARRLWTAHQKQYKKSIESNDHSPRADCGRRPRRELLTISKFLEMDLETTPFPYGVTVPHKPVVHGRKRSLGGRECAALQNHRRIDSCHGRREAAHRLGAGAP